LSGLVVERHVDGVDGIVAARIRHHDRVLALQADEQDVVVVRVPEREALEEKVDVRDRSREAPRSDRSPGTDRRRRNRGRGVPAGNADTALVRNCTTYA
jgi:hypothetical protein